MRTDSWLTRLVRTISRQTPAYQRVGVYGLTRFSQLHAVPREELVGVHHDVDRQLVAEARGRRCGAERAGNVPRGQ